MDLQNDLYAINYEDTSYYLFSLASCFIFADDASGAVINRYLRNKVVESDKDTQVWKYIEQLEAIDVVAPEQQQIKKGANVAIIPTQVCNLGRIFFY